MFGFVATTFLFAATDPILGTWKINNSKSKFNPGPGPKSVTTTYTQDGDWIVGKTVGISGDGSSFERTNRYKLDGQSYPFDGPSGPGKITLKKIDDLTTESTVQLDAGGTTTSRTVFSKDLKTRTQTVTGVNSKGQKLNHVVVSDRQ
jgi:hypothetical protein